MTYYSKEERNESNDGIFRLARLRHPLLKKVGGAVSLCSYLNATKPEMYSHIKGAKAIVKAKELNDGNIYLYIDLPLYESKHEELRVAESSWLEEGDEVWISSIIVLFLESKNGETIIRYDARCVDNAERPKNGNVKFDVINECTCLMTDKKKGPTINVVYEKGKCPEGDYAVIDSGNGIMLKIDDSNSWRMIKLDNYKNARPLTHGLILAEISEGHYDVLNSDGSIICKSIHPVYYGSGYLNCKERVWLFNEGINQWEEKHFGEYKVVPGSVGEGLIGVYIIKDLHNGRRIYKKDAKKYYYLDYNGNIQIEIEDTWIINGRFHNGKTTIEREDGNDITYRTIDKMGTIIEEKWVHIPSEPFEEDIDRDNWDAMTDGMYGDYPEEGFDGDYESLGY